MTGDLIQVLNAFAPIGLDALGGATLMDRVDRKYLVPAAGLTGILETLAGDYQVLEVEGRRVSTYTTRYFDTADLALYHAHHAGRLRRVKVRVRRYDDAANAWLEVKRKTGRGRTVKERLLLTEDDGPLERLAEAGLLGAGDLNPASRLSESMLVEYARITLVRPAAAERVTLDLGLSFTRGGEHRSFPGVVIAEAKQAGRARSPFIDALKALGVREGSLSKYCAGIATLEPAAKSNRFRPALKRLGALGALPLAS